jgi:hypothetical protein
VNDGGDDDTQQEKRGGLNQNAEKDADPVLRL